MRVENPIEFHCRHCHIDVACIWFTFIVKMKNAGRKGEKMGSNVFIYTTCMHCDSIKFMADFKFIFFFLLSFFLSANIKYTISLILNQFEHNFPICFIENLMMSPKMHVKEITLKPNSSIRFGTMRRFHLIRFHLNFTSGILMQHRNIIHHIRSFQNQIHNYQNIKNRN